MTCRGTLPHLVSMNLDSLQFSFMKMAGVDQIRSPALVRFGVVSGSFAGHNILLIAQHERSISCITRGNSSMDRCRRHWLNTHDGDGTRSIRLAMGIGSNNATG